MSFNDNIFFYRVGNETTGDIYCVTLYATGVSYNTLRGNTTVSANGICSLITSSGLTFSQVKNVFYSTTNTIILLNDGKLKGCGLNTNGELGIGSKGTTGNALVDIPFEDEILSIYMGPEQTLFLTKNGDVYGCGKNTYYQMSKFVNNNPLVPTRIPFPQPVRAVAISDMSALYCTDSIVYVSGKFSFPAIDVNVDIPGGLVQASSVKWLDLSDISWSVFDSTRTGYWGGTINTNSGGKIQVGYQKLTSGIDTMLTSNNAPTIGCSYLGRSLYYIYKFFNIIPNPNSIDMTQYNLFSNYTTVIDATSVKSGRNSGSFASRAYNRIAIFYNNNGTVGNAYITGTTPVMLGNQIEQTATITRTPSIVAHTVDLTKYEKITSIKTEVNTFEKTLVSFSVNIKGEDPVYRLNYNEVTNTTTLEQISALSALYYEELMFKGNSLEEINNLKNIPELAGKEIQIILFSYAENSEENATLSYLRVSGLDGIINLDCIVNIFGFELIEGGTTE